jgi:hypothetical protein
MTDDDDRAARIARYNITQAERDLFNRVLMVFGDDLRAEFGERTDFLLVNYFASTLAGYLRDPAETACVITVVNHWLAESAECNHGPPVQLQWVKGLTAKRDPDDEAAERG